MTSDRRHADETYFEGVDNRKENRRVLKDKKANGYYYFTAPDKTRLPKPIEDWFHDDPAFYRLRDNDRFVRTAALQEDGMRQNRKAVLVSLALFVTLVCRPLPATAVSDTYDWFKGATGYEEVFAIAKADDRPFLLLFAVDWCGYCTRLKKDYLNVSPVEDVVGDHLRVEINPEDGDAERKIANTYGVKGYPTFVVLYPGQETYRVGPFLKSGAMTNDEFAEQIKTAVAWSHAKRGAAFWKAQEYRASLPFFERAVKIQPDYEWGHYGNGF